MTNSRKQALSGEVGIRFRDLVRQACRSHEIDILQGAVSCDRMHVLLSCPPSLSPSNVRFFFKWRLSA
ncbi:transposase [Posidoniimonas corsicana]|uniref:transposase n=1 Tax=Posidoniimonas corsicana TaxID=1938618 RepID=UPI0011B8492F